MKHKKRWLTHLISYPFILAPLLPVLMLDLLGEMYHRLCFPLYGLTYIKRSDYIVLDRHKLKYLNWFQKISCAYCGYINGFLLYAAAIAQATEGYWCSIINGRGDKQPHQKKFLPYDDEPAYQNFINK